MQHAIDYTPYEGMEVTGWPVMTMLRGRKVMTNGHVDAEPGYGQFLARGPYDYIKPSGILPDGFDASAFPLA
jgi:dihydropyrimidinase